jgi:uncharacterized protein YbjT (DUF2867 family)
VGLTRDTTSEAAKGLQAKGADVRVADFDDVSALTKAFTGELKHYC